MLLDTMNNLEDSANLPPGVVIKTEIKEEPIENSENQWYNVSSSDHIYWQSQNEPKGGDIKASSQPVQFMYHKSYEDFLKHRAPEIDDDDDDVKIVGVNFSGKYCNKYSVKESTNGKKPPQNLETNDSNKKCLENKPNHTSIDNFTDEFSKFVAETKDKRRCSSKLGVQKVSNRSEGKKVVKTFVRKNVSMPKNIMNVSVAESSGEKGTVEEKPEKKTLVEKNKSKESVQTSTKMNGSEEITKFMKNELIVESCQDKNTSEKNAENQRIADENSGRKNIRALVNKKLIENIRKNFKNEAVVVLDNCQVKCEIEDNAEKQTLADKDVSEKLQTFLEKNKGESETKATEIATVVDRCQDKRTTEDKTENPRVSDRTLGECVTNEATVVNCQQKPTNVEITEKRKSSDRNGSRKKARTFASTKLTNCMKQSKNDENVVESCQPKYIFKDNAGKHAEDDVVENIADIPSSQSLMKETQNADIGDLENFVHNSTSFNRLTKNSSEVGGMELAEHSYFINEPQDVTESFADSNAFTEYLIDDQYMTSIQCHMGSIMSTAPILANHECLHSLHTSYKCSVCRNVFPIISDIIAHKCRGAEDSSESSSESSGEDSDNLLKQQTIARKLGTKNMPLMLGNISTKKPNKKIFECNICKKVFPKLYKLTRHQKGCELKSKTVVVKKEIENSETLLKAIPKRHRPYKCPKCKRDFMKSESLTTHKCVPRNRNRPSVDNVVKTEPLPILLPSFKCIKCPKSFNKKSYLQKHVNSIHNPGTIHSCVICGATFSALKRLKCHLLTHKTIKSDVLVKSESQPPIYCAICGKEFWHINELKDHTHVAHSQFSDSAAIHKE